LQALPCLSVTDRGDCANGGSSLAPPYRRAAPHYRHRPSRSRPSFRPPLSRDPRGSRHGRARSRPPSGRVAML